MPLFDRCQTTYRLRTMRPSTALRQMHWMLQRHHSQRRCSFARPSNATGGRERAPSQRHAASFKLSSANFSTTSRTRSPPDLELAVEPAACGTDLVRPHDYTAGRWLKQDKLQRDARHLDFDFAALGAKAVALCPKARSISACTKLEGGFNKAFPYTMDSGERIVARVPTRIAGPRRLTTNSEVATMAYIKSKTSIPVPNILDWSDDKSNPTGCEYIFMEHVPDVQLSSCWDNMSSSEHLRIIKSISDMIGQMAALELPAFGSIYFRDAPIDPTLKIDLEDGFCIGPSCNPVLWNCRPGEADIHGNNGRDHGPWRDLREYCNGLLASAESRIPVNALSNIKPSYWGSIAEHEELLRINEKLLPELAKSPVLREISKSTLLHADLNMGNIFVSESRPYDITGIIDWQSTAVEPAFIQANETPDVASRQVEDEDVDEDETIEEHPDPSSPQTKDAKTKHDILLCNEAFEVCMHGYAPIIAKARNTDSTLIRPFLHCNVSWRDSAPAVRQELIELSVRWKDRGMDGSCPYDPTIENLEKHAEQYPDFEMALNLKLGLMRSLHTDSDGWLASADWDVVKQAHDEMFREWLRTAGEAENLDEEKARELWPFDQVRDS